MPGPDSFFSAIIVKLPIFHNLQIEMNAWLASRQKQIRSSSRRRFHLRAPGGPICNKDNLSSSSGEKHRGLIFVAGRHSIARQSAHAFTRLTQDSSPFNGRAKKRQYSRDDTSSDKDAARYSILFAAAFFSLFP